MFAPSFAGFVFGLSLIVAIGAQNAFVLRQGVLRGHLALVVAICAGSDAVLITAGTAGLGALVTSHPGALSAVRIAGAAALAGYGLMAARRAVVGAAALPADGDAGGRRGAALTCLALTWLNPHVYLDIVLLGSVAAHWDALRWSFAAGAAAASLSWFTVLAYTARALAPVLRRPGAWRVLDTLIAVTMFVISGQLLLG